MCLICLACVCWSFEGEPPLPSKGHEPTTDKSPGEASVVVPEGEGREGKTVLWRGDPPPPVTPLHVRDQAKRNTTIYIYIYMDMGVLCAARLVL